MPAKEFHSRLSQSENSAYSELYYLKSIINTIPETVYWKNRNGVYLGCNQAMLAMLGLKSIVGKTDRELPWRPEEASLIEQSDQQVIQDGREIELEERITLDNGQTITMLTRKKPLLNEEGIIIGILGMALNISEQKRLEEEHRHSHSQLIKAKEEAEIALNNIVANMPGHVYWKNTDGVYLGCNQRQARNLGLHSTDEILGKTDFDLPWPKHIASDFRANDLRIMASGVSEIVEEIAQMDGHEVTVLSQKTPLWNNNGQVIGVLGISMDISDRKKAECELKEAKEKAEAANQVKTEFLENIRHDIRTPLTGISGFASIICEEVDDPRIKEYVKNLNTSCTALLNLLNEILEVIEISSGDIPLVARKFSLRQRMNEVINLNLAKAASKHLTLKFNYDDKIPNYLIGDSKRIHRIAIELISNALNFTEQGHVTLTTMLAKEDERSVIVKLIVEDTGIGIEADKQEQIFLQFKRLVPSYRSQQKGAGLGLSIVKQLVSDLDGEVYVESESGKGSRFICIIPLKKALLDESLGAESNQAQPAASPPLNPDITTKIPTAHKSRILIVEDNDIAARVAKLLLERLECIVEIADTGLQAINMAQSKGYDLIFMDIGLPDIDGYETARRIRIQELNADTYVPIIALTAQLTEENSQTCLNVGMNAVLSKPLDKEKAQSILAAFIPYRQLQDTASQDIPAHGLPELTGKVIDYEAGLEQLGNAQLFREMLTMLVQSFSSERKLLAEAYQQQDWPSLKALAHRMKSGASYCAAMRLKQACSDLEDAIANKSCNLYPSFYSRLIQEIEAVRVRYNEKLLSTE
ncbi:PAS domain-containing protein [Legionella dresdenensis]|uniref:histidine kinase n=1 Tax=Legionella dresdenensis TaxID=450200 RepID=A0ABV8CGB5_9GAMM